MPGCFASGQVKFDTRTSKLSSSCTVGYFGNVSEFCEPCYVGAVCYGGPREPVSIPGFYIGNMYGTLIYGSGWRREGGMGRGQWVGGGGLQGRGERGDTRLSSPSAIPPHRTPKPGTRDCVCDRSLETRSDACKHPTRLRCLAPRPCDPPESCIGEDQCSMPYTSKPPLFRCATCSKGYVPGSVQCVPPPPHANRDPRWVGRPRPSLHSTPTPSHTPHA